MAPLVLSTAPTTAPAQVSRNVIFHSNLDERQGYNDIWGYTAPNGDEYALLGVENGLAVINITDPGDPYETGFIGGPVSIWRDIKTLDHYAYVTTEGGGGLEIVDLTDPENPAGLPNYTGGGYSSAHNLYIDTSTRTLYLAGSNLFSGGLRILSLDDPTHPVEVGSWETAYLHDVMVQNGRAYGAAINNDRLYVLDVSDPASVTVLGSVGGYPHAFTHNAWVTADDRYVMTTDEEIGAACRLWDVSNLPAITPTGFYLPNAATIPHNAHIEGNLAIISHYTIGLRIVDISDPYDLVEVGYYDTYPWSDGGSYRGCWGAFPFFGTSTDLIVASDTHTGLWVLEYQTVGTVAGRVTNAESAGDPIPGATLEIVETGRTATTDAAGVYVLEDGPGDVTLRASAYGYAPADIPVTISVGDTTTQDAALVPLRGGSVSGTVRAVGGGAIAGATVELEGTPLTTLTDESGAYGFGIVAPGDHTLSAWKFGYDAVVSPVAIAVDSEAAVDVELVDAWLAEDFEGEVSGWGVSGSATRGQWQLADPEPTEGGTVQTGDDHTPAPGVNAWITGPLAGVETGTWDVDGGDAILKSPFYDVEGLVDPQVSYWRWFVTGTGDFGGPDTWKTEMSTNAGSTWIPIENTDVATPEWVNVRFAIRDFGSPGPYLQFRFTASDTGDGSITEAGLDDFTIFDLTDEATRRSGPPPGALSDLTLDLGPGVPNPFRAGTGATFRFRLPDTGAIEAVVHDVGGRRVRSLAGGIRERGVWTLTWDGRTGAGSPAPAGVYFVTLRTEAGARTRKLVVLR